MKTFQEFLKEQAPQFLAEEAVRESKKKEWASAVHALIRQMKSWLDESDSDHVLRIEDRRIGNTDEPVDSRDIDALSIWLGRRCVAIEPVAFEVLGPRLLPSDGGAWRGRLDLIGDPFKFKIYRFVDKSGVESWWIVDPDDMHVRPFTRERFEAALLNLFS